MKKTTFTRRRFITLTGSLAVATVCAGCLGVAASPATTSCPKGLVNDPYPGRCRLFRDTNNSGYCDLSESDT